MSIFLGGTGSANELHDYEEGNWSPSLSNGGSFGQHYAKYVKVGRLVCIFFEIYSVQPTNNTADFIWGGLPFTASGSSGHGFGNFAYVGGTGMSNLNLMPIVQQGNSYIYFHRQDGTASRWRNDQQRSTANNQPFIIGHMYETDA